MLGTDGCSSNNNLDMFEEMKIAALLQKHHFGDTELMSAEEILQIASGGVAKLFPNIAGELTEGAPADLLLIDTQRPEMTPAYNPASNLVYAGGAAAVDTVISGGRMLMAGREVPGEEEILAMARERARLLRQKSGR
jgi:5-methylthioadenosine/S-adenosylhomocysteine deaminase